MQQFIVVGRIGGEVRYSDNGQVSCARISIADNMSYKDAETGEKKQFTSWIPAIGFGSRAEFMRQYLHKGMMIAVSGNWRNQVFEKAGRKEYSMVLHIKNIQFCDSKEKQETCETNAPENTHDFIPVMNVPFGDDFTMPSFIDGLEEE